MPWTLLLWMGCVPKVSYPDVGTARPDEPVVQLRRADVMHPFGVHYYFVSWDPDVGRWTRQEVLARRGTDGEHLFRDRFAPDASLEKRLRRRARLVREFRGERAERLLGVLATAEQAYSRQHRYVLIGPNSNSFAAWVLRRARVGYDFPPRAVGANHPPGVGLSDSRTGIRLDAVVVGLEVGLLDGIEVHLGPGVWGLDLIPPAILTPFGRLGVPEPHRVLPRPEEPGAVNE